MSTTRSSERLDSVARRWAEDLGAWAIPEEIISAAPESPWGFPAELFSSSARSALEDPEGTPSRRRALEAVGDGATVLDVGAGAGAASLPLAPPATHLTAVDESDRMLRAFDELASARSVPHELVRGRWPDVSDQVMRADVVVCHHVVYNVSDIVPFVEELDAHAKRRVVIELTASHPQSDLNSLWRKLHGLERPQSPNAEDLVRVLEAMEIPVRSERFRYLSAWYGAGREARVAFARRRLCVGPERDSEIESLLPKDTERELVTLWWDRAKTQPGINATLIYESLRGEAAGPESPHTCRFSRIETESR